MADARSTAKRGDFYMKIRDSFLHLDVLYANQFERKDVDQVLAEQTEENFYRGAPPVWLNFHISEQTKSKRNVFIKRDGYDRLVEQIQKKRKRYGTSVVKLFHERGSGGTTLAMQVLWDLRKTFRSAVLTGSTSDITSIANEVICLFTAGRQGSQSTVLLLVNNEQILDKLQDSVKSQIAEQKIATHMPVLIILNCVRKDVILQSAHVGLKQELSKQEQEHFDEKREDLRGRFSAKHEQFHGFNIMQTNFSHDYVSDACAVFETVKKKRKPRTTQLAAFLSLLNAYVPGSYLSESQCLEFLKGGDALEDMMSPFGHLIIAFGRQKSETKVCMAHHMIAQRCTELLAQVGVKQSDTAKDVLTCLCLDEVSPSLSGFVKDMLTKREKKKVITKENRGEQVREKEEKERFSRLILNIQKKEGNFMSASVLRVASEHIAFAQNPFFAQALARFYYIVLNDYNKAEKWARIATEMDPQNSFIADTLGQVHKNHLRRSWNDPQREILQLAAKGIGAFKHEEQLAEKEQEVDMKDDGMAKVSNMFNNRGLFGYLQVCNMMYDSLVRHHRAWGDVLTNRESIGPVLEKLGDGKLSKYHSLIRSLRDEVEKKCAFFDTYLTYSKPDMNKDDEPYILSDMLECCKKYIGDSPPKYLKQKCDEILQRLKEKMAGSSAGVLACLDRKYSDSQLREIRTWWEKICSGKDYPTYALRNYILAHIVLLNIGSTFTSDFKSAFLERLLKKMPLSSNEAPESHMLILLLHWPKGSEDKCDYDLNQLIQQMRCSYGHAYEKYFRSRYLRPLFFVGKGEGLSRIVHRSVLDNIYSEHTKDATRDLTSQWSNEQIFKTPEVQKRLLAVHGVVQNCRLYATFGNTQVEVDAHLRDKLWKSRQVSFYLGFTIRGPVAFGIQTKNKAHDAVTELNAWAKIEPEVSKVDEDLTYSLRSEAGRFECGVSGLRWVCEEHVSLKYKFCLWEGHTMRSSCVNYIPAGPLMDITLTAGKLREAHLPHWICIDDWTYHGKGDDPKVSNMFVVLHVDTGGDYVEGVSEVTPTHVKLVQLVFSPRGVMIDLKEALRIKVNCMVLIFETTETARTLHVYLLPDDPAVKQAVEKTEESYGSITIRQPKPNKSLKYKDWFFLTTDVETADINPKKLMLRHERTQNYFKVFVRDAGSVFSLELANEERTNGKNVVWTCKIREGDHQKEDTDRDHGQHFVDRHWAALVSKLTTILPILDRLLEKHVISNESYDRVRAISPSQAQMREILSLLSQNTKGKLVFYKILCTMPHLRSLMEELEGTG